MRWFWRVLAGAGVLAGLAGFVLTVYAEPGVEGVLLAAPLAGLLWSAVQTLRHESALVPRIVLVILSLITFGSVAWVIVALRSTRFGF